MPPDGTGERLGYVDALRGYAILGVIAYHVFQYTQDRLPGLNRGLGQFCEQGARGVQLFFIVSAFTLSLSVRQSQAQGRFSLRRFYCNRFFRIAPLFWLAIVFYAWEARLPFTGGFRDGAVVSWPALAAAFSFTNGANPHWVNSPVPGGWSIVTEMWFYLPLPFLLRWIRNGTAAAGFALLTLAARGCLTGFLESRSPLADGELWSNYLFFWFPNHLPIFALGIALYFLAAPAGSPQAKTSAPSEAGRGAAWLLWGAYLLFALVKGFKLLMPYHFLYAAGGFAVAAGLSRHAFALVCNRPMVALGRVSYSAYICHFAILDFGMRYALPGLRGVGGDTRVFLVFFGMVLAATCMASLLLFLAVERPGQALGRRLLASYGIAKVTQPAVVAGQRGG